MQALTINNLSKVYPNGIEALKGISLSVQRGDFFALLGPNGAGKSTTIGIITSLVNKTGGKVQVFQHDLDSEPNQVKASIGLVPQEFNFTIFQKCRHILLNQAGYYGIRRSEAKIRTEKYLKQLDLWHKRDQQARFLSGGQKRRLMIARALVHNPPLLILDEPTAGVDIEIRRSMWYFLQEINRNGTTIILTTHYLEEAEHLCKNIAIINHGKIIEAAPMQTVLKKLQVETFILYLTKPLIQSPTLSGYNVQLQDPNTLEVEIQQDQGINALFAALASQGITVASMRNKTNRLEELFLKLTKKDG
jgi:ABC-2 type transport system ATP-binding protein